MTHCFDAEVTNVSSKIFVSIADVGNSYWENFNHISTYVALKVTGSWADDHVVGLSGILSISDLAVGKPLCIPFDYIYHGYCTLTRVAVVVV